MDIITMCFYFLRSNSVCISVSCLILAKHFTLKKIKVAFSKERVGGWVKKTQGFLTGDRSFSSKWKPFNFGEL